MEKRLEILKLSSKSPHLSINISTAFYNVCRHKSRFYRYLTDCTEMHSIDDKFSSKE